MQDPTTLYRLQPAAAAATSPGGVLLVALGGFVDAGSVQHVLSTHLLATSTSELVATFDVDQLLDLRARRPIMVFETNRWESYDAPKIELLRLQDRDGTPYYMLRGPEPDYQWERMVAAVRQVADHLGISLVVSVHGIPMAVPHTRPVSYTAHATRSDLIGERVSPFGRVAVPASFSALLELRLGEAGEDALGFAVHVPHYLTQTEWAEGALAALNAVVDVTGLNLPNDDLVAKAQVGQLEIAAEIAKNTEASAMVTGLEEQYDAYLEGTERPSLLANEPTPLPTADELASDVEDFLRSVEGHNGSSGQS
ncbi:MAG: PAC2 family protein [Tetrasphaera sp.]|nr:PAC2 family protein [Tetrasphaera sp.]